VLLAVYETEEVTLRDEGVAFWRECVDALRARSRAHHYTDKLLISFITTAYGNTRRGKIPPNSQLFFEVRALDSSVNLKNS
jgi:hypothetical protein